MYCESVKVVCKHYGSVVDVLGSVIVVYKYCRSAEEMYGNLESC